ncbi:MAG: glycosyltransferase family 39 protein [Chloroflexi bacterium]|nr:glycosyltransferase family 39 protein [Chloroflexota bacterium]
MSVRAPDGRGADVMAPISASAPPGATTRLMPLMTLIVAGATVRLWELIASGRLSADEAIPGLMARHILLQGERPVFYWGQAYFGALESYLLAALFGVAGFHPWLIFVPPFLASVALIPLVSALADQLGGPPAGLIAAVPIAIPPAVLARVLGSAGGGFALAVALQLSALLCTFRALRSGRSSLWWSAAASLSVGLACWVWQPSILALPPLLIVLLLKRPALRRPSGLAALLLPAWLALVPMLVENVHSDWATVSASAYQVRQQTDLGYGLDYKLEELGGRVFGALGGGDETFGGANVAQALLLTGALLVGPLLARNGTRAAAGGERRLFAMLLLATALLHTLGAHDGTRYLLPLVLAACCSFGAAVWTVASRLPRGRVLLPALLCAAIVGPNLAGYGRIASLEAPDQVSSLSDTSSAVQALEQLGLRTGYADYWTAYPLSYVSGEQIVVAPSLPNLWTGRVDRYPPYTARLNAVDDAGSLFLLVDRHCPAAPYLAALDAVGAGYQVRTVAHWLLVWDIRPRAGAQSTTLSSLRSAISSQQIC